MAVASGPTVDIDHALAVRASMRAGMIVALLPAAVWAVLAATSIPHLPTIGASLSVAAGAPLWIVAGWLVGRLWASELVVPGRVLSAARIGLVAMTATVLGATVVTLSLGVGPVLEAIVEGRGSVAGGMASVATYWLVGVVVVGPFSLLLTVPMACAWLALARRLRR